MLTGLLLASGATMMASQRDESAVKTVARVGAPYVAGRGAGCTAKYLMPAPADGVGKYIHRGGQAAVEVGTGLLTANQTWLGGKVAPLNWIGGTLEGLGLTTMFMTKKKA